MSNTPIPEKQAEAPLLAEFPPATHAQWKALVEAELKGAPFDKKMISTTYEGIALQPVYRREDGAKVAHAGSLPGFPPFVRGATASGYPGRPWDVSQEIALSGAAEFNDAARAGLQRGLTALNMVVDQATRKGADPDWAAPAEVGAGGLSVATLADLERALDGIDLETVPLFVRSGASGMPFAALLAALARKRGRDLRRLRGCIEVDPLGVLAHEGRLPQSLDGAYREMAALTEWAAAEAPLLQTVCVHGRAWHEAGANAVQELAFTLAMAADYLRAMHRRGLDVEVMAPRLRFAHTVGVQFFVEIAKLRASRLLWSRLISVLGGSAEAQKASLHVRTSFFNKTSYDPHVNLLRTTVEAFGAVLGGCDSLQVGAFDEVVRTPDEFSTRIARNQQLILREECHLTSVIDPAGGSWFVESLTDQLARRAWGVFQEIEKQGGMHASMRAGWPQREAAKTAESRLTNVARRRDSIVGTNAYANAIEKPLDVPASDPSVFHLRRVKQIAAVRTSADDARNQTVLERLGAVVGRSGRELVENAVAAVAAGATLGELTRAIRIVDRSEEPIVPVCFTRASSQFERLRRAVDAHSTTVGHRLKLFLANMGPPKQHRARADFSRGFLELAGFEVLSPSGFATPEEAALAAVKVGADAVCVCSTDETYPAIVAPLVTALRARKTGAVVIVAGYPPDQIEALRGAGVNEFIHLRANALEVLTHIAKLLGVTV
jgi:methylmalonyl-CoA mutase